MTADVSDASSVDGVGRFVIEEFGGLRWRSTTPASSTGVLLGAPLDEWHRVIDVNLWGVIHGIRSFVPRILATGEEGHVVNIASMAAVRRSDGSGRTRSPSTACSGCPTCSGSSCVPSTHRSV